MTTPNTACQSDLSIIFVLILDASGLYCMHTTYPQINRRNPDDSHHGF